MSEVVMGFACRWCGDYAGWGNPHRVVSDWSRVSYCCQDCFYEDLECMVSEEEYDA